MHLLSQRFLILILTYVMVESIADSVDNVGESATFSVKLIERKLEEFPLQDSKITNFLIQEVDYIKGETKYKWPWGELAFKRNTLDKDLARLIFEVGKYFGPRLKDSYILLHQHPQNYSIYSLVAIYIRNDDAELSLEFTHEKLWTKNKTKFEMDVCQGVEECSIVDMILGTCLISKNKCNPEEISNFTQQTQSTRFLMEVRNNTFAQDFGFEANNENQPSLNRQKRMMLEYDYYKAFSRYMGNSSGGSWKSTTTGKEFHVPTSFDLLEMSMESTENGTDFVFKNRIDRRKKRRRRKRKSHGHHGEKISTPGVSRKRTATSPTHAKAKLDLESILHRLTCFECYLIGDFFQDLEEDLVYSQALAQKVKYMVEKGKFQPRMKGVHNNNKSWFVGFGNCFREMDDGEVVEERPASNQVDDVIDFYLRILRVDCKEHEGIVEVVRSWFLPGNKILEVKSDLTVGIWMESPILKTLYLSPNEYSSILGGLLFSKFTSVYSSESSRRIGNDDSPHFKNLTLSKEINFMSHLVLEVVDSLRSGYLSRPHLVKLTRSLVHFLKTKFIALLVLQKEEAERRDMSSKESLRRKGGQQQGEDEQMEPGGSRRHLNSDENYNDRLVIMGVKEFILFGLRPLLRSGMSAPVAFTRFWALNLERIKLLVEAYV